MAKENDEPAFPHRIVGTDHGVFSGMSLRDYFAGQVVEQCIRNAMCDDGGWDPDTVALHAYLVANAMLAARKAES
jgi:hypothetical protein